MEDEPVEIVTLRTNGHVPTPGLEDEPRAVDERAERGTREVYFSDDGYLSTTVYERTALEPGDEIVGPAILEESGSTSLVHPDSSVRVSDAGSIIISRYP